MHVNTLPKKIKFGNLIVTDNIRREIQECLDDGHLTMGRRTERLEIKWRNLFGYKNSTFLASGTSALIAAFLVLREMGCYPRDQILCPALSFIAIATSICAAGFKPGWDAKSIRQGTRYRIAKAGGD